MLPSMSLCPPAQLPSVTRSNHPPLCPQIPPFGGSQPPGNHPTTAQPLPTAPQRSEPEPQLPQHWASVRKPTLWAGAEPGKSLGRRSGISTADLCLSTGLELTRTNGKEETPNPGPAASSNCRQAMQLGRPRAAPTQAATQTLRANKEVAASRLSVYTTCDPRHRQPRSRLTTPRRAEGHPSAELPPPSADSRDLRGREWLHRCQRTTINEGTVKAGSRGAPGPQGC